MTIDAISILIEDLIPFLGELEIVLRMLRDQDLQGQDMVIKQPSAKA